MCPETLGTKKFQTRKKILGVKTFESKKIVGSKIFLNRILGPKSFFMLPGQMSPWQLASFKDGPRILALKFG